MRQIDENVLSAELNPTQKQAAIQTKGPQLILAGAGSGKTRTLTYKIAHLISCYNVDPRRILAVTFTNKAAGEMKERIKTLLERDVWLNWMGTFHSICVRFLRKALQMQAVRDVTGGYFTSSFSIYDDSDQKRIIRELTKGEELEAAQIRKLRGRISSWKNKNMLPEEAEKEAWNFEERQWARLYGMYQEALQKNNAMDFDDLLLLTVDILRKAPEVCRKFSAQFQYVFIDEYQDTNPVQYDLVRLVTDDHENITVVGDDDQSIYGWRGADISIIRNFHRDFGKVNIVKLEQNYRSTRKIVQGAGSVIKNNERPEEYVKEVFSEQEEGEDIRYLRVRDENEEASCIATDIQSRGEENYENSAVFYRTNSQSRVLEEELNRRRIPNVIIGGTRFYDRREVKDIFSYLRALVNQTDTVAFLRIINVPRRGIGGTTTGRLQDFASQNGLTLLQAVNHEELPLSGAALSRVQEFAKIMSFLQNMMVDDPLPVFIERVMEVSGYKKALIEEDSEEARDRLSNLDELISAAVKYQEDNPDASLEDYLQEMALLTDADTKSDGAGNVKLMTIHSSKGLEFPYVYIAGCDEGLFPLLRNSENAEKEKELLEEERRLFYVGATRAEKALSVYSASVRKIHGRDERFGPSRFLNEMDQDVVQTIDLVPASMEEEQSSQWSSSGGSGFSSRWNSGSGGWNKTNFKSARKSWAGGQSSARPKSTGRTGTGSSFSGNLQKSRPIRTARQVPESSPADFSQENLYLDVGRLVQHARFGKGEVLSCSGSDEKAAVTVQFASGPPRKLILKYANLQIIG